jgi:hypothetical protein
MVISDEPTTLPTLGEYGERFQIKVGVILDSFLVGCSESSTRICLEKASPKAVRA